MRVEKDTTVAVTFARPTLTISPTPTNGSVTGTGIACGSGTSGDCEETVNAGDSITLTAAPATNYAVQSWSGGGCSRTGTTCTVRVEKDTTVAVTFAKPTLEVSPTPTNGSVTGTGIACGSGTSGDCEETVNAGDSITLTASPVANYAVQSWSGGGCPRSAKTCTVVMDEDKTVSVTFAKPTLEVSPVPTNGSVTGTGIACGSGTSGDCEETVNAGTSITLTASPATNYAIWSWSGGGCTGTGTTCTVKVEKDTTVGVGFQPYDFIYRLASSEPATPTGGTTNEQHVPSGWQRTKPLPTASQPVWRAQRKRHYNNEEFSSATAWGGVAKIEDLDFIYNETTSAPATPTGGETVETHTPSGWTRNPVYFLGQTMPTFLAERTRHYKNGRFARASSWGGVKELLTVNSGGPYQAYQAWGRPYYTVTVLATARGGTSPYSYRWEGKSANSRSATYLFESTGPYLKSVTVTDGGGDTATASATITARGRLRIGGASDDGAHEVPLGGALLFVWGGEGTVSATSKDSGIATVSVSGAEIVVSGVSAGSTEILVKLAESEFRMPVQVGGGG